MLPHNNCFYYCDITGTNITCVPNYVSTTNGQVDALPLCNLFTGPACGVYWNIAGNVHEDENDNCGLDGNEARLKHIKIRLEHNDSTEQLVFSNSAGNFSFDTGFDTFAVQIDTLGLPFHLVCPSNDLYTNVISVADSFDSNDDFALTCKPGYDLAIHDIVRTSGSFFPMQNATVRVHAGDAARYYGTTCNTSNLSGTVTLNFEGPVGYAGNAGTQIPAAVSGNTVVWNVNNFATVDFDEAFAIILHTATNPALGSTVCVTASVVANSGTDNNLTNNEKHGCYNVVNSFDPNSKEVYPASISELGGWLTYTIYFQNTGNAPAENVVLRDTLDDHLDASTFELLGSSHENLTQVLGNNVAVFSFPHIFLPDSTNDETHSHGWVQYRVKTNGSFSAASVIHNTASIYFDFNDPVVTNDAVVNYCSPQQTTQNLLICEGDSVSVGVNRYKLSGTYEDLFVAASGCDSLVTTVLTLIPSTYPIDTVHFCQGDSIESGGVWYSHEGVYPRVYTNVLGCDSTAITVAMEFPPMGTNQQVTICSGDSASVGNHTYTLPGTYIDVLPSSNGCDSVVTTVLTVAQPTSNYTYVSMCSTDSIEFAGIWYSTPGQYLRHFTNSTGCDSSVILTLRQTSSFTESIEFCQGDSAEINGFWYHQGGSYIQDLVNMSGCDSTLTINVNILQPSAFNQTLTVCPGQPAITGNSVYELAGTYTDVLPNAAGCDSVVTTVVDWYPVETPEVHVNGALLAVTSPLDAQSYQWYACANNQPVAGANASTFTADSSGSYWVQITDVNGCALSSACYSVAVGIESVNAFGFDIYPNPSGDLAVVRLSQNVSNASLRLTDLSGKTLRTFALQGNPTVLRLIDVASGAYLLELVKDNRAVAVKRLTVVK